MINVTSTRRICLRQRGNDCILKFWPNQCFWSSQNISATHKTNKMLFLAWEGKGTATLADPKSHMKKRMMTINGRTT